MAPEAFVGRGKIRTKETKGRGLSHNFANRTIAAGIYIVRALRAGTIYMSAFVQNANFETAPFGPYSAVRGNGPGGRRTQTPL